MSATKIARTLRRVACIGLTAGAAALMIPGQAGAATQIGWTGGTPPIGGVIYLHNSTITDDGGLRASSKIWTSTGSTVAPGIMGVRARLFKSGVICEVAGYQHNTAWISTHEAFTSAVCGTGSYNSHGFVRVYNGSGFNEYVTFPSNPIDYSGAASARSQRIEQESAADTSKTFTVGGQTFGPASQSPDEPDPDFVAAYSDEGEFGYVRSGDLANKSDSGTRLSVYDDTGASEIGSLTVR
ncbi:hypothetical protein [Nocardia camponoti]|uniref:Uncharacterized protein n=1 Tax=Nocardia camponoti TaxID=1616106 RepID=A0A917Q8B6_9NOCA|nr:hypothetical protein [Nocardia camponoti]GGK35278.1 hypothetical protein GCM10011591_03690 [Nocardia camponoti]